MIYTKPHILKAMEQRLIKIDGFNPDNLGMNSYDLTLGNEFWLVKWKPISLSAWFKIIFQRFGYFKGQRLSEPKFHYQKYNDGDSVSICNGNTLLAIPKELVGTGDGIVVKMKGKSTTRRTGMTVCDDAGLGDVGFGFDTVGGVWVSELTGHTGSWFEPYPYLIVGEPFCQLVFEGAMLTGDTFYNGQYGNGSNMERLPAHCMLPKKYRGERYTVGYDWSKHSER